MVAETTDERRVYRGTIREDATEKQEVDLDLPLFVRDRKGLTGGNCFPYLTFSAVALGC